MLRFESEAELNAARAARRQRFNDGATHAPERDILAGGIELMRAHPDVRFAFRMNTGAGYLLYAAKFHELVSRGVLRPSDARFMRFGFPGCPDVIAMLAGGRLCFAEAKADRGVVSDDQQAVLDATNAGGGLGVVFHSVDELERALRGQR